MVNLFSRVVERERYDEVFKAVNAGKFTDCGSVPIVASLLKRYLAPRPLPRPLIMVVALQNVL